MTFQPVPTYADPVEVDEKTKRGSFSPTWLSWFLQLSNGGLSGTIQHDGLAGLQGGLTGEFYHLTLAQFNATPFRNLTVPSAITPSGSPFAYNNADTFDEDIIVTGGTGITLQFSRDNVTYYALGVTAGMFHLSPGDYLKVTYTAPPTLTKVPR